MVACTMLFVLLHDCVGSACRVWMSWLVHLAKVLSGYNGEARFSNARPLPFSLTVYSYGLAEMSHMCTSTSKRATRRSGMEPS